MIATDLEVSVVIPFKVPEPFMAEGRQVCDVFDTFGVNFVPSVDADRKIHFRSGNRTIKVTEYYSAEEYPTLPDTSVLETQGTLNFEDVLSLEVAKDYTSNDEQRLALMHVAVVDGNIVATNAHYLYSCPTESKLQQLLLKHKTIELLEIFSFEGVVWNVFYTVNNGWVVISNSAGVEIYQRFVSEKYPNWKAVVPKDNPIQLTVMKKELLEAIKQGKRFAGQQTKAIEFIIGETVELRFEDLELEREYTTHMQFCSVTNCEAFSMGFNYTFLEQILKDCAETVVFQLSTPNRPALIGDNFLLMPVDLKK